MKQLRKILRFRSGEETYPTILTAEELQSSPFFYTVNTALSRIEELKKSCDADKDKTYDAIKNRIPNNIIAVLGNRGSGKTSCMRTVTGICRDRHDDWLILDEIDPSFFDRFHNILDIFIGNLYGIFKNEMKEWERLERKRQDDLRKINDGFRNVQSALRYLKNDVKYDNEYEIDELCHLNEGGRLRELLFALINDLLKYKKKNFLVVCIDDLDLNVETCYRMLEELRKYLLLPNVAIIIAARYDQLFDNICLELTRHYKDIPERVSRKDIAEMAERYLNKILPLNQRCEMPTVESYIDAVLLIDDEADDPDNDPLHEVEVRVPDLIFKKTRYLFYNTSGIPSLVIPRNLRDLRMLVSMLVDMEDFTEGDHANQDIFKNYFFNEWIGIIEPEYRPFIKRMLEEEDLAKINRFVVTNLYDFFLKETEPLEKLELEITAAKKNNVRSAYISNRQLMQDILNPRNSYWNVSVGDVVVIMNAVRAIHNSGKTLSLLFVLSTFYSFKLYESYNQMTALTGEDGLNEQTEKPTTNPELKTSVRADIPSYFRLTGGAFFAASGETFLPLAQNDRESRESRIINGNFLLSGIRSVVKEYKELEKLENKDIPRRLKNQLRLCEFFMLTVGERLELKTMTNRRLINEPVYFSSLGATAKNLVFDITLPFVTGIYPKLAYDRFHKDIYGIALKDHDSLLNRMRNHGKSRGKENDTWELMSKAAIRNMEILEDLTAWLYRRRRNNIRPQGRGLIGVLADFFNGLEIEKIKADKMPARGYCVKTYDRGNLETGDDKGDDKDDNNDLPYYMIDYSVFSELGKFLNEIDETDTKKQTEEEKDDLRQLRMIFEAVMSEEDILVYRDEYEKKEVQDALYPICGHSVTDNVLGWDNEKITVEALSEDLAKITIDYGYDFRGKLPKELEYLYDTAALADFSERIEKLNNKKTNIEDEIIDKKEYINSGNEDIKILKKGLTDLNKSISAAEKEQDRINVEIYTNNLDLRDLESVSAEALTKDQAKQKGSIRKKINNLTGKTMVINNNLTSLRDNLRENESKINDLEGSIKSYKREIRRLDRQILTIDKEIERITYNYENRPAK